MTEEQKRAFLAIGLSIAVFVLWQNFFAPQKNVQTSQTPQSVVTRGEAEEGERTSKALENNTQTPAVIEGETSAKIQSEELVLRSSRAEVRLQNNLVFTDFSNGSAVFKFKETVAEEALRILIKKQGSSSFQEYFFTKTQVSEEQVFLTNTEVGLKIKISLLEDGLSFSYQSPTPITLKFLLNSKKQEAINRSKSTFFLLGNDLEKIRVGDEEEKKSEKLQWFGVDFHYHLFAIVPQEKESFSFSTREKTLLTQTLERDAGEFKFIYVKKNYDELKSKGHNLHRAVDFGTWSIISVPILRGLQFFYKFIPNYGVAILLLTILIRLLTFPLQFKSYGNMKKMQVLQPELKKIKERFKDDPQRVQQETMALFKRNKANPLGGCFPLLLQMPVFFAFYNVLYEAVELVGAPFVFHIKDLSLKDPYYILPVLMGLSMFFQQKLTPSPTADNNQKRIMMIMPLVIGFFMKDLPAGLNLYIFCSTVVGIFTQLLVYKKVS